MNRLKRNIFIIITAIAVVFIWRGTWNLLDRYFLPDQPILSNVLSIGIGLLILLVDDFELGELSDKPKPHKKNRK